MDYADGSAFLERKLVGFGVDGYGYIRGQDCTSESGMVPIYMFRENLTRFSNVESFTFFTSELVHQVRIFWQVW